MPSTFLPPMSKKSVFFDIATLPSNAEMGRLDVAQIRTFRTFRFRRMRCYAPNRSVLCQIETRR